MVGVDVLFVLASAAGDALGSPSISPGSSRMPAWHRAAISLVVPPRALRSRWPFRRRLALTDQPAKACRLRQVLPGRRTKKAALKPISGWAGARNHGGAPAPARQLLSLRLQGLIALCSHCDRMTPTQPRSAVRVAQPQKMWRIHRRVSYVRLDGRGQSLSGTIQKGLRKCRLARLPWGRG